MRLSSFLILVGILIIPLQAKITPTEVFKEANSITSCLETYVLKLNPENNKLPSIKVDVIGASPKHVYSLTAALERKLSIYFKLQKISFPQAPQYPDKVITPGDVIVLMEHIRTALNQTNQLECKVTTEEVAAKKPSDVMVEVTYSNLWIDQLVAKSINPSAVFMQVERIHHELTRIAKHKNITLPTPKNTGTDGLKLTPTDVFKNGLKFYTTLTKMDKINFDQVAPSNPYNIESAGIVVRPSDVFTLSTYILYYLYSVEEQLGMSPDYNFSVDVTGKKPKDVYKLYNQVNEEIDFLMLEMSKK